MLLNFHIHYATNWGERLFISGNIPELGSNDPQKALPLPYLFEGHWDLELEIPESFSGHISYKYFILNEFDQSTQWEFGQPRELHISPGEFPYIKIEDQWRSSWDEQNAILSSAFLRTLLKRKTSPAKHLPNGKENAPAGQSVLFNLRAANVPQHCNLAILGSHPALGAWDIEKALVMDDTHYPTWSRKVDFGDENGLIEYKFLLVEKNTGKRVAFEERFNRALVLYPKEEDKRLVVLNLDDFSSPLGNWKGAGVAIPVFSLRSEDGMGVGEFQDLKKMADWAEQVQLKMIQILPVNDTTSTKTWTDSYPYGAISVFALHPLYINLESVGVLADPELMAAFDKERKALNEAEEIDYEAVMKVKMAYLDQIYIQEKEHTFADKKYQAWFEENKDWLLPYAAFCVLRDSFGTADFSQWNGFSKYSREEIEKFSHPSQIHFDKIAFFYFVQFHLHLQLLEATEYARQKGIILKGDIPIGIVRNSVDAWVAPELYYMDKQAGAPPDGFAVEGQNWGFPTYNWGKMAENNYAWWRQRMTQMAAYFDAYRIDHILGFFRIWQIPGHAVQGLMGQFNPSLPFSIEELQSRGLWFDYDRLVKPYIRWHMLEVFFEEHAASVAEEFLHSYAYRCYSFKPEFDTQKKVRDYLEKKIADHPESEWYFERVRKGLYALHAEVLFFEAEGSKGRAYNPRIALHHTYSYRELDPVQQAILNELYIDYFYKRHDHFWKEQALVKLPALKEATDMLVCGEDLGMVPDSVPDVMSQLGILSLEIQRMPKDSKKEFFHPADAPFLSVVSTSTHDMPTLRGWWEQDPAATQKFYNQVMGRPGAAPFFCEPWICEAILEQHFHSPAMWAVLPVQDLLAMDGTIRRENPFVEQINVPANPTHYWRYRMHLSMDDLMEAKNFNQKLKKLVIDSARSYLPEPKALETDGEKALPRLDRVD